MGAIVIAIIVLVFSLVLKKITVAAPCRNDRNVKPVSAGAADPDDLVNTVKVCFTQH